MKDNNNYPIKGVLHAKVKTIVTGKKDPTQTFEKFLLTLEVTSSGERKRGGEVKYVTETEFPQFEAFNLKGVNPDDFNIGDFIEIRFFLSGKKFTYQQGARKGEEGIMNRNVITWMKYADLDAGHPSQKGKITVDSTSDVKELDKVFIAPDPNDDDEGMDQLPF